MTFDRWSRGEGDGKKKKYEDRLYYSTVQRKSVHDKQGSGEAKQHTFTFINTLNFSTFTANSKGRSKVVQGQLLMALRLSFMLKAEQESKRE